MMYLIIVLLAATVLAEPPISKSYLPPSPNGYPKGPGLQGQGPQDFQGLKGLGPQGQGFRPQGFPGAPEVVAARSLAQGREQNHGNDFSRNSLHDPAGHSEGYDAFGRNGESSGYNFEYMVNEEGTEFGHREERERERAQGEYTVVLPDGRRQTVSYEADERGFKPRVSYQDSEDRTGYDSNAQFQNGARNHGNYDSRANGGHDLHGNGVHGNGGARANGY